jgi:P pilus assembly chaperone PapD
LILRQTFQGFPMPQTTLLRRLAAVLAACFGLAFAAPAAAQGDLLVAPTRVIITGGGSAEVILSNIGSEPATYRIMLELRRMNAEGDLVEVPVAEANAMEKAALEMVRFAPRRIVLPPGQPQAVRITARPAAELPDGEYRVHMVFRSIPAAVSPEEAERVRAAGQFQIRLQPVYGISIPVFIRKGRLEAGAAIGAVTLERQGDSSAIAIQLSRTGNRSVYGEVIARDASGQQLAMVRGVALYPEVAGVKVDLGLTPETLARARGPVQIEYRELPENGGKTIAKAIATLN